MKMKTKIMPVLAAALAAVLSGCGLTASDNAPAAVSETSQQETSRTTETSVLNKTQKKTAATEPETETDTETETATAPPETSAEAGETSESSGTGLLASREDLEIYDTDGEGWDYEFVYDHKIFEAVWSPDNWKIVDSYRITDHSDMVMICGALSEIHPVHGSDYESWRTAEDMAYEWEQHNLAYRILPEGNSWRENARDVDLDPEDQGKSLYELYEARTGSDLFSVLFG